MSVIRSKNTKPEVIFRKLLRENGITGYSLHKNITGKPDIYFPDKHLAVFIDGCFWHGCNKCYKIPKTNKRFWKAKILQNTKGDKEVNRILVANGARILRFWEHDIEKNPSNGVKKIKEIVSTY